VVSCTANCLTFAKTDAAGIFYNFSCATNVLSSNVNFVIFLLIVLTAAIQDVENDPFKTNFGNSF
jgi:hypothetical protein